MTDNERTLLPPDFRFKSSALLMAVLLTLLAFLLGSIVVSIGEIGVSFLGIDASIPLVQLLLSSILLQGVTFGAVAYGYYYYYQRAYDDLDYRSLREFVLLRRPSRSGLLYAAGGLIAIFGIVIVISAISELLGFGDATSRIVEVAERQPLAVLAMIPVSYLVVAPGEEVLFRGIIQGHLREAFRPIPAVLLASIVFAVTHFGSITGPATIFSILSIFGVALVLGGLYEYTDNLTLPILVHGTYNALQFALIYATLG